MTVPMFTGVNGGDLPSAAYRRARDKARMTVSSEAGYASPPGKRIYD
ncbi:hypothetical protein ACQPYK_12805 [Streptosporangium sp. CA-135522]